VFLSLISPCVRLRVVEGVFESTRWKLDRRPWTWLLASHTWSHRGGCGFGSTVDPALFRQARLSVAGVLIQFTSCRSRLAESPKKVLIPPSTVCAEDLSESRQRDLACPVFFPFLVRVVAALRRADGLIHLRYESSRNASARFFDLLNLQQFPRLRLNTPNYKGSLAAHSSQVDQNASCWIAVVAMMKLAQSPLAACASVVVVAGI